MSKIVDKAMQTLAQQEAQQKAQRQREQEEFRRGLEKLVREEVAKVIKDDRAAIAAKLNEKRLSHLNWLNEPQNANKDKAERFKVVIIVSVLGDVMISLE